MELPCSPAPAPLEHSMSFKQPSSLSISSHGTGMAEALLMDQSPYALRPANPSALFCLCDAVADVFQESLASGEADDKSKHIRL